MKNFTIFLRFSILLVLIACMGTACKNAKAQRDWELSGHADTESLAFRDWDNASNPDATVQASCASCHSTQGFIEFLSTNNRTIAAPPLATENTGITCEACHTNSRRGTLREPATPGQVTFTASGETVTGLEGTSAVLCGQCHQGRSYFGNVDTQIQKAFPNGDNASTVDVISDQIGIVNPHYRAAFAAIKAQQSKIGYVYGLTALNINSTHAGGTDCISCHNQHSTAIDIGRDGRNCQPCHQFTSVQDVQALNTVIPTQEENLLATIQDYAADNTTQDAEGATKAKACIAYDGDAYPYWFNDANCDGTAENTDFTNKYASFTPRLAKACYNYLVSVKDPGGYAHNKAYMVAILAASITNLRLYNPDLGQQ